MTAPLLDIVNRAIGQELGPLTYSYSEREAALYALGIGAPADPMDQEELKFVYELSSRGFAVFPTFALIYSRDLHHHFLSGDLAGIVYNPMMVLHGEQYLELLRPLPVRGTVRTSLSISQIYDKGSGMLLTIDGESADKAGEAFAFSRWSVFIRGLGDYGGDRGPSSKMEPPKTAPDIVHQERTSERQALLYRLSGDSNPLHADPQMAAIGNYDKPILHGLCTYGFAARAILKHCCANEPLRLRSIGARFSQHVFPGETLQTEIWSLDERELRFQTRALERNAVVLSNGRARLRPLGA
ncbi:MAG: MaoC/PaaZ C-terminal domain-containing protein [Chloroflexi bacterium]|nr:MaoC/PaaZ C-terminal domain-containing protein [Chloroflexota bacterium]